MNDQDRHDYLARQRRRAERSEWDTLDGSVFVPPLISTLDELQTLMAVHPDRRYEDDPRAGRRVLRTRLG